MLFLVRWLCRECHFRAAALPEAKCFPGTLRAAVLAWPVIIITAVSSTRPGAVQARRRSLFPCLSHARANTRMAATPTRTGGERISEHEGTEGSNHKAGSQAWNSSIAEVRGRGSGRTRCARCWRRGQPQGGRSWLGFVSQPVDGKRAPGRCLRQVSKAPAVGGAGHGQLPATTHLPRAGGWAAGLVISIAQMAPGRIYSSAR